MNPCNIAKEKQMLFNNGKSDEQKRHAAMNPMGSISNEGNKQLSTV